MQLNGYWNPLFSLAFDWLSASNKGEKKVPCSWYILKLFKGQVLLCKVRSKVSVCYNSISSCSGPIYLYLCIFRGCLSTFGCSPTLPCNVGNRKALHECSNHSEFRGLCFTGIRRTHGAAFLVSGCYSLKENYFGLVPILRERIPIEAHIVETQINLLEFYLAWKKNSAWSWQRTFQRNKSNPLTIAEKGFT